jgi:hypothetical protein
VLSVESVGLPPVMMSGHRGEVRCCGLCKVGMVETVEIRQVIGIVMLKSAKDRIIVDTPGQHVPPRVQYAMACLLIRNTTGIVPCSNEWELP